MRKLYFEIFSGTMALSFLFAACVTDSPADAPASGESLPAPAAVVSAPATPIRLTAHEFPWLARYDSAQSLLRRIAPPEGAHRVEQVGPFGNWLRALPLQPDGAQVMLYNGQPKGWQEGQHAVLDIDIGERDLQQCADAVMRLRAEHLWAAGRADEVSFNFTSGDACRWAEWRNGTRPVIGRTVTWSRSASPDRSYANFKSYLTKVYTYAGTASLEKELKPISTAQLKPGDVFIQGGHPGHAIMVMDLAEDAQGARYILLAQSYMPAQSIHILKNLNDAGLSPWYKVEPNGTLQTPEWGFTWGDAMTWE